ncbi:MAG: ABC transporter ATP-binding protein [Oscillospiraceae bacterium]|nr:ABC transporter ATP-binding protein [Oscillospiraceae bacterium]
MAKKEKKKKEPKRKPKYGLFSCVGYIYKLMWEYERSLAFTAVLTVPVSLILSAIGLYTSPAILRVLETSDTYSYIALVIVGLLGAKLVFDLANNIIRHLSSFSEQQMCQLFFYLLNVKRCDMDWYLRYVPKVEELRTRTIGSSVWSAGSFHTTFSEILAAVLKFLLFGTVISTLNPLILLLLIVGCAVDYAMGAWLRRKLYQDDDSMTQIGKKLSYIDHNITETSEFAKEIRLYSMKDVLHKLSQKLFSDKKTVQKRWNHWELTYTFVSLLLILVRDGAAYAFLIHRAVAGQIDTASFVLYFSAITSMSGFIMEIIGAWGRIEKGALKVSDIREYFDIKGLLNRGEGIPLPTKPFSIEFKDVSYQYPEGEKKILDHISFKIEAGEKIALVGLNGAGKTTLVMLMCGLLVPDEGEVLLDGHSIFEYNRDEMYTLFGVIPQTYHLHPVSLARNIAAADRDDEIDRDRLNRCIEIAGLTEKITSLPDGAETPLDRTVNDNGIELSGGETQKLLLARLLYRNPLCIILDEPTAALDPIAEDKMYRQYNDIASHATSVFISHRLASTRFCDRIYLLDDAQLAEIGTHDELMAVHGKYRELFDVQSKYYREGVVEGEE